MSLEIILQFKWKIIVNWELAFGLINQLIKRQKLRLIWDVLVGPTGFKLKNPKVLWINK
jgi:hypothetical protein